MNRMYAELAEWWPLLSPLEGYADEAAFFLQALSQQGLPASASLLELGCGGGSNAFYLKKRFAAVTLTDVSPQMLAISRTINPECEHQTGDMRTLRLGRKFDVVFIHDAIDYITTPEDLRQTMETAFVHCHPGGVVLLVPDYVQETFQPDTDHGGYDGEGRAIRFLEWSYIPEGSEAGFVTEYAFLLREGNQMPRVEYERHLHGLFPRAEWVRLLKETGLHPEIMRDEYGRDVFMARRP